MTELTHARKLGEFLVDLGVFTSAQLEEISQIALQINLPLGRTILLSNNLQEEQLRAVLQIQALVRQRLINLNTAKDLYAQVKNEKVTLSDALQNMGISHRNADALPQNSRLGALLIDAGLVTTDQVQEAEKVGFETGTPVGRMLVLSGVINHSLMARALEIQVMLREGKMSHGAAIELLKAESLRILPLEQTAEQRGFSKNDTSKRVRLGELLMLSGILSESDMLNVIELGLTSTKPLGDVLIELNIIDQATLEHALKMQSLVSRGELDIRAAALKLQEGLSTNNPAKSAAYGGSLPEEIRIGDLLESTGLVDEADILEAIKLSSEYPAMLGKMLVVAGSIDEGTLLAALRCQYLMRNNQLSKEQAHQALLYAQRHRISLDDALEELGVATQESKN